MTYKTIEEITEELRLKEIEVRDLESQLETAKVQQYKINTREIQELINLYGVKLSDLREPADPTEITTKAKPKGEGGKLPPKYRDPVSGLEWSGRGAIPKWMTPQLAQGKNKEDFLIKNISDSK